MKSIFLSAGHSTIDPGAVTTIERDGKSVYFKEADVAVEVRNIVSFYLSRAGVPHELDGNGTENIPLAQAVKKAKRHPLAVEFHCNASSNKVAGGVETLSAPDDMKLGAEICKAIAAALDVRNRGAKPENSGHHSRLAFVQAGGIIVELFFISNPYEVEAYRAKKWLLGKAIAEVLVQAAKGV